jgi:integrase/recombinase XerD
MQILQNVVGRTVIALWFGHESVKSTQMCVHTDTQIEEQAMAKTSP